MIGFLPDQIMITSPYPDRILCLSEGKDEMEIEEGG